MRLSQLIKVWDNFHTTQGGFCDLEKSLRAAGIEVVNDISPEQPKYQITMEEKKTESLGNLAVFVWSMSGIAVGLYLVYTYLIPLWMNM